MNKEGFQVTLIAVFLVGCTVGYWVARWILT